MRWPETFQEEEPMAKAKKTKRAKRSKTKARRNPLTKGLKKRSTPKPPKGRKPAKRKGTRSPPLPGMLKTDKQLDLRAEKYADAKDRRTEAGQVAKSKHDSLESLMKQKGKTRYRTASGLDVEVHDRGETVTVTRSKQSDG